MLLSLVNDRMVSFLGLQGVFFRRSFVAIVARSKRVAASLVSGAAGVARVAWFGAGQLHAECPAPPEGQMGTGCSGTAGAHQHQL